MCHQCGAEMETVEHMLFHCQRAQILWKLVPVQWDGLTPFTDALKEWWRKQWEIGKNGDMEERQELTAYLMWQTWKGRNSWLYNSERWLENEIIQKVWNEWLEFKNEQAKQEERSRRIVQAKRKEPWWKPEMGSMKLNVCSDIAGDGKGEGLGIIARDGWGEMIQAWSVAKEA